MPRKGRKIKECICGHTRILCDPFNVAVTMSKSELIHRRKWSDGFLLLGHGNPASAKNCKVQNQKFY